ncbi:hypothetical protein ACJMK2_014052 [Sinanodonta woodiana]|uniref:DDE Tnp4 domain-containing protein n=1 Tax=Sinanodonta woodiana TaxID=1069815 RepID=A0ABD3V2J0_SINWO
MDYHEFRRHFRIGKTVYNLKDGGRDAVSPAKQLLVFMWHISNLESVSETANIFVISPSTAQGCVHTVAKVIANSANKFIKWPDHDRRGFLSGCQKGFPSVQLQIVVDDRMLITDAFVG